MEKIEKVTLGADPEFFLYDEKKERVMSAEGIVGGTKDKPIPITPNGHCIQEDNVMVEFNIPPAVDAESFVRDINFVVDHIAEKFKGFYIPFISPSAILESEFLQSEQALTFGCEPDFNAWSLTRNDPPASDSNLRTCGGHIHIGYNNPDGKRAVELTKAMDLFLGVPSIIMDSDKARRTMYGKAGAFRPKEYGVEYRTLSNFWIANDELIKWAFNSTMKAIDFVNSGKSFDKLDSTYIENCINNSDVTLAKALIERYKLDTVMTEEKILDNA